MSNKEIIIQKCYQQFILNTNYSRNVSRKPNKREQLKSLFSRHKLPTQYRKETLEEAYKRLLDFFQKRYDISDIRDTLLYHSVRKNIVPAMRALASAGPALESNNLFGYNCSYVAIESLYCLETLFIRLLHGVGVGYSVEKEFINKLPTVPSYINIPGNTFFIPDSKEGWVSALRYTLQSLYAGVIPVLNYSQIRPKGARLKTTGGYASGPEPLKKALESICSLITNACGRKLKPLEVSDICCIIADCVVVGGSRRAALMCLSSLDDEECQLAKYGSKWFTTHPYRSNANFSVAYNEKPSFEVFCKEWEFLQTGCSGERGIFNRQGAYNNLPLKRKHLLQYYNLLNEFREKAGTNPCGEIILLSNELCNLSEVIIRPYDTEANIFEKLKWATVYGVLQAGLTDFPTTPELHMHTHIERLLGVSMTGIMSNKITYDPTVRFLQLAREVVRETASKYARKFGIPEPTAVTALKPSGNVTEFTGAYSPGINPAYSQFGIRTVRKSLCDPFVQQLMALGLPHHTTQTDCLFHFPYKTPDSVLTGDKVDALFQLELWLKYKVHYCDHNPSCSIYVKPHEWEIVRDWVYKNWDNVCGLAFFPYTDPDALSSLDAKYDLNQLPFRKISEKEYYEAVESFPIIDLDSIIEFDDTAIEIEHIRSCEGPNCSI